MSGDGEGRQRDTLACPSSQPDIPGALIFGVVTGTVETPQIAYLKNVIPLSTSKVEIPSPLVPTEVFRLSAPCAESRCQHFGDGRCNLARRLVGKLERVVDSLPPCSIRRECKWWAQEGREACFRCPQVVTQGMTNNALNLEVAGGALNPNAPQFEADPSSALRR
jgi:hypothetical protein